MDIFSFKIKSLKINCIGYAISLFQLVIKTVQTIFVDEKHYLYDQNNDLYYASKASKPKIAKIVSTLKQKAGTSRDKPSQIIQSIYASVDINNAQSMPSKDAMRQQIKRVRRQNVMSEPTSLDSLIIPEDLKHTLNGKLFLINESEIGNDKILLFTTLANLRKLELAKYWIMDGTFKTVPTIFHQLYSIHAPVGHDTNSRIFPMVFALLSSKSKECYIRIIFQDLQDYASENNIVLQPDYILTDFEQAAIFAVKQEFINSQIRLCLFHLGQSMWRKVQSVGLLLSMVKTKNLVCQSVIYLLLLFYHQKKFHQHLMK